jgi:hypothetical protein
MKELSQLLSSDELGLLFARLNPLDVEQFYTAYSLWSTQQRIQALQTQIDSQQQDITANMERQEQGRPSALALATLARLQSNGVSDITILDRMLDCGEAWLDRTIQHLEYCERLNVIRDGYTTWCEHALEGAYDWIDSIQGQETENPSLLPSTFPALREFVEPIEHNGTGESGEPASEIIEALFLQKLMSDDAENADAAEFTIDSEDSASMLDTTLKIPAIPKPATGEALPLAHNVQPAPSEHFTLPTEQETESEGVEATPVLIETQIWQSESFPQELETIPVLEEAQSWQQETSPESVEATPMLEETPVEIEQDTITMIVIEEPQALQTEPQQPPAQSEEAIETLEPLLVEEYTREPVYLYEPEDAQGPVDGQGSAYESEDTQKEPAYVQEHSATIQNQYDGDAIKAASEKTPIVERIAESASVPSFDTIYSIDQVETPNWVAAVESEQGNRVRLEHQTAPIKRDKGFWRTMLAFLFHV